MTWCVRIAQRQNNMVRHFGTATQWHGVSLWHSDKITRCVTLARRVIWHGESLWHGVTFAQSHFKTGGLFCTARHLSMVGSFCTALVSFLYSVLCMERFFNKLRFLKMLFTVGGFKKILLNWLKINVNTLNLLQP